MSCIIKAGFAQDTYTILDMDHIKIYYGTKMRSALKGGTLATAPRSSWKVSSGIDWLKSNPEISAPNVGCSFVTWKFLKDESSVPADIFTSFRGVCKY